MTAVVDHQPPPYTPGSERIAQPPAAPPHPAPPTAVPDSWPDLTDLQGITPVSHKQANLLLNALAIRRREAVTELDRAQAAEADYEWQYRKAIAEAWGQVSGPAAERQAHVQAITADLRHARDISRSRVKTAQARIAQLKDEQIDVMFRGKWSQLIDAAGGTGG